MRALGEIDEAIKEFRIALRADPEHADARNNLGVALSDKGMLREAVAVYRLALHRKPQSADTHNNLGVVFAQQGKRPEAAVCYRRALELRPSYAEAKNNLGNVLRHQGKLEDAEACLREALRLKPEYAEAYNNLAIILVKQERVDEAIENYRQALRLKPDYPEARKNLGLALLGKGEFAAGWPEYEFRWNTREMPPRKFTQPRWEGEPLHGKTILLYAEQGLGDTIQFIRYAARVAALGGTVMVECQKALVGLFGGCPGIERIVPQGEALPAFDNHAALMSVPRVLGTVVENIPAEIPYLAGDPERIRKWSEELKGLTGFKIGIAWQGSRGFQDDHLRSTRVQRFEPLARVPGTRLISLQKEYGAEQLRDVRGWNVMDVGNRLNDFLDTAALMKHLDLVITVDTAVAHLAGALGVPVWLALPTASDWRWLQGREDTPWYPTMRLFRQRKQGGWAEVFERMARELESRPPLESASLYGQRGLALLNDGKVADAVAIFRQAVALGPKIPALHNNLAVALDRQGKKTDALAEFEEAVRLDPAYADARHNLGNTLRHLRRYAEAEVEYRHALKLMPDSPDLCNHLGIALLSQAKHAEAEACFQRCLRLKPDHPDAHNNLGVLFEQLRRIDDAIACYRECLRLKPDSPDTHKNLALALLLRGDYPRGWAEYEWRWKAPAAQVRNFSQPRWDGRSLDNEPVLLFAEQGLGDTIQFARYARLVKERGAAVLVECPVEVEQLLKRCPGIDRVIPQGAPLPDFAYQVPFMSLPGVFGTTVETVPAGVPYLSADPRLIDTWGKELAGISGMRVGIVWQGSQRYAGDAHRSAALRELAPLAGVAGVRLISLQKGYGSDQLQQVPEWKVLDLGSRVKDFADTAAVMMHLDLVISVDTAVAHLAGALGVPVWLALSTASDWRWLQGREDSPWYPTVRLFRQKQWGTWPEVFQRMAVALRQRDLWKTSTILAGTAPGELLDKITILQLKRHRVGNEAGLDDVYLALGKLLAVQARCMRTSPEQGRLMAELRAANEARWDIEEDIRQCEERQEFGERFVELARSQYRQNACRAELKEQVNRLVGWSNCKESSDLGRNGGQ